MVRGDTLNRGTIEIHPGLVVMRLEGDHYAMGYQHGALLRSEIEARLDNLDRGLSLAERAARRVAGTSLRRKLPDWAMEELEGMAEGAGLHREELAWLNAKDLSAPEPAIKSSLGRPATPGWVLAVYRGGAGKTAAAVTRPGSIGAMGGVRQVACFVKPPETADPKPYALRFIEVREDLHTGLCGMGPGLVVKSGEVAVDESGTAARISMDAAAGSIRIERSARAGGGTYFMDEHAWRPGCLPETAATPESE